MAKAGANARYYNSHRSDRVRYQTEKARSKRNFVDSVKLTAGCIECGFNEAPIALDLDHVRGVKTKAVSAICDSGSWQALQDEIEKCDVRCANHHRIRTGERI